MTDKPPPLFSIGFVGGGHLSVVSAVAALEKTAVSGNTIYCYSDTLIELPLNGVEEPGLLDAARTHAYRLRWTTKLADFTVCDLVYFALDVPTDAMGNSDLAPVQDLLDRLLSVLSDKAILVNLSQVPPGWTKAIGFPKARLFYQVETLIFGQALNQALNPARFIVGSVDKTQPLPHIYRDFLEKFNCPIAVMAYESAELAKIAINLYLASMVTTSNLLADLCTKLGASWPDIVPSLRLDPRIGPLAYLSPGLGLTSGNIKRDMITAKNIAGQLGVQAVAVEAMLIDSAYRMGWIIHQLKHLGFLKALSTPNTIGILGLSYKPNTPIMAGSAAEQVLSLLPQGTIVRVFEPMPMDLPLLSSLSFIRCQTPQEATLNVSLLMILTPNQEMADLDWPGMAKTMQKTWVLDPFGVLNADHYPMLRIWQLGVRGPEKICR